MCPVPRQQLSCRTLYDVEPLLNAKLPDRRPSNTTGDGAARARARAAMEYAAGILSTSAISLALWATGELNRTRPGLVLLTVIIAMTLLIGVRAGWAAAVTATLWVWWLFTVPAQSFRVHTAFDAISIAIFVVTNAAVLVVIRRLALSHEREEYQRRVAETIVDEAPIGIALFAADLRFVRVNDKLASINGIPAADHVGRRPSELHPAVADLYGQLLRNAVTTGSPIVNQSLSHEDADFGIERHYRASYYPILDAMGAPVAVTAIVEDVTVEVLSAQRNQLLVTLATSLSEAPDSGALGNAIAQFLSNALTADVTVAQPTDHAIEVIALGQRPTSSGGIAESSTGADVDLMDQAVARNDTIYDLSEKGVTRVAFPVRSPSDRSSVMGAFCVRWAFRRDVSPNDSSLLETTASMAGLAWSRIELAELVSGDRFRAALDAMLDHVAIGTAIRDAAGTIVDFEVNFMNAPSIDGAGRTAEDLTGQRMREMYPAWQESGLFDSFVQVVETGVPFVARRFQYDDVLGDGREFSGYWSIQVTRLNDGYIAATRDETQLVEAERIAEQAGQERVAVTLLQHAALPERRPELRGVELGLHYRPANDDQPIGGDWYDAFKLDDSRSALVIADVSGHGSESAAFMVQVRNVIRALAFDHLDPAAVMAKANQVTSSFDRKDRMFVTCCYGVIDADRRTFRWSVAGHPPPLLQRGRARPEFLHSEPGPPLTVTPSFRYSSGHTDLLSHDRIVMYTDGLIERRGEVLDVGFERLRDAVLALRDVDPQQAVEALGASVHGAEDDIAVLCADFTEP